MYKQHKPKSNELLLNSIRRTFNTLLQKHNRKKLKVGGVLLDTQTSWLWGRTGSYRNNMAMSSRFYSGCEEAEKLAKA